MMLEIRTLVDLSVCLFCKHEEETENPQWEKREGVGCVKIELGLIKIEDDGWIVQLAGSR